MRLVTLPLIFGALLLSTVAGGAGLGPGRGPGRPGEGSGEGPPAPAAVPESEPESASGSGAVPPLGRVIPAPSLVQPADDGHALTDATVIRVADSAEARAIGESLAALLRPATGFALPVTAEEGADGIRLVLDHSATALGEEGYRLESAPAALTLTAYRAAGLFRSVQTLRQLLPVAVEETAVQDGPWPVPGGTIEDTPRFGYRGAMLDVARHFFGVDHIKRFIDEIARYKFNTLHLHLTDDQGWRLAIESWPKLAERGGATAVGGGEGGYYTQEQYRDIVAYAAERYIEVIPEIDMPGHTAAALASYPELTADGAEAEVYTGTDVGFSSLAVHKPVTYDFVDDVLREVAALTPGRYLHIGGDEADATSAEDYALFMARAQETVVKLDKTVIAWHQLAATDAVPGAILQYWGYDGTKEPERAQVVEAVRRGARLILSPGDRAYLDHKYTAETELGLEWAGLVEVDQSYDWDPGTYLDGVPEEAVYGVEAPLWTETVVTQADLEYLVFPRLPGIAELGWSAAGRDWDEYRVRLAGEARRWRARGVTYYASPLF
ncbi:beta-N-acetylhexosaminidase [Streptomyces sp. NPDC057638]|uniref:beta-N-acetylhexosaminidase n=1 Tax=Streptomyces sp. NPDC057638 TaxID=3346190 RepID=UPI0036BE0715